MAVTSTTKRKSVKDVFSGHDVKWGPIGKDVYQRTYSRTKADGTQETWQDTVLRVVEGNLAFVQDEFHEPGEKEKLLNLLYDMEVVPGGRHLWATGVSGRQYVSNCHSSGWSRKDLTEHFVFTFEELMKGGGVGSNYSNKYIEMYPPVFSEVKFHVVCNPSHPNIEEFSSLLSKDFFHNSRDRFVVEDSREGWSNILAEVLRGAWYGRETPLIVDVSMLREKGAILRSFGGKSSGPDPLVKMLSKVASILNLKVGKKMSSLDMMEIDHEISHVVVAGGIRRSARMSIKSWADKDIIQFLQCKSDPEKHWTTNISVEVDEQFFRALRKKDDHALNVLSQVVTGMKRDGEPGFWNSSLSAIGEIEPPFTTNPCVTGDTLVGVADGRLAVPISVLAESGNDVPVYAWNPETRDVEIKMGLRPRWTGKKKVYKVTLDDGSSFKATDNHRVVNVDGAPIQVKDLKPRDRLKNFTRYQDKIGKSAGIYWHVVVASDKTKPEHQMVANFFHGAKPGLMIHHKDENSLNNDPDNLGYVGHKEHSDEHGFEKVFRLEGNPRWCGLTNDELIEKGKGLTLELGRAFTCKEWICFAEKNSLPVSVIRESRFTKFSDFRDACADKAAVARGRGWGEDEVEKVCEGCRTVFTVPYRNRETCFCSKACSNRQRLGTKGFEEARVKGLKVAGARRSGKSREEMKDAYLSLKASLMREPWKKEWESECRSRGIPFRLHQGTYRTYVSLQEAASSGNHYVVCVTELGEEDVYNITVEDTHNFAIVTNPESRTKIAGNVSQTGIFTFQCGEVPFGQWDVCNLGHINLERFAENTEGAREAFRLMTRFLIRATFGDIMNPHQKTVVSKNRRIGVGFFGYHHWVVYQGFRFSESHHITSIREKMRGFYDVCRKEAREYAFKLRIPEPIKVTCVAPTGSISLMPGVTSGCQPIFARYYVRRVRYSDTDANLKALAEKGYPIEASVNEPNTKIVSFFCKDPLVASCEERGTDLSLVEEQSEISLSDHLAVQSMIQKEFADNAISYTINFDPKRTSTEEIVEILKVHLPHLKGTTLMPEGNSRPQMPFERIDKEQFEEAEKKGIGRVSDKEMECLNGVCPVK